MAEEPVTRMLVRYDRWLSEQRLSAATRRSYRRWVAELLEDLAAADPELGIVTGRGAKAGRDREAALRDLAPAPGRPPAGAVDGQPGAGGRGEPAGRAAAGARERPARVRA